MNECRTWASLSDKAAIGEPLTGEERLFLRSHPSGCPVCAPEASLWESLEKVLEEPERLASVPSSLEPPPRLRFGRFSADPRWQRRAVAGAVALVLGAAAGAALWSRPAAVELAPRRSLEAAERRAGSTATAIKAQAAGVQLAFSAGETLVNQRPVLAGERLHAGAVVSVGIGQACLLVPPGVSVCLDSGTELALETLEADTRRFRLLSGHAVAHLEPQPPGSTFGFETAAGSVVAKGTVFSLRTDGSTVSLRVHEGVVQNRQGARTSSYQAPSTALLSHEPGPAPTADEAASESRLVELAKYFSDRSRATLLVTAPAGSSLTLGDFYLGMTPVSALVLPGDYRMEVSRAGFAPIVERLTFEPGARIARDYEAALEQGLTGAKESAKVARGAAAPTAAELLEQARELRAAGRYQDAHGAYQRLLSGFPSSAEARVALVSLGELQLSQLADPAGALRSFDSYLRGGGALRQEASYGRIRALRRLGKQSEARAAANAFLSAYPNSVQAATLRKDPP